MSSPTLTQAQQDSLVRLEKSGWHLNTAGMHYELGQGRDGCGCVMVHATSKSGGEIWFGIEPDGYAHS
jgi:hypothetical protein